MGGAYVPPHRRRASSSSDGNSNNGNNDNRSAPVPRTGPTPRSDSLASRMRNANRAPTMPRQAVDYRCLFFGDSFVRLFGLVQHPAIRVTAFKGASAKGLGRLENDNRARIRRQVEEDSNSPPLTPSDRCVFSFGSVDVHLSYYHKTYVLGETIDLEDVAGRYVDFVASLSTRARKIVLGVYPSPLDDDKVGVSLVNYGSLSEEHVEIVSASEDVRLHVRQERVRAFNRALARHCAATHDDVQYADVLDAVLDGDHLRPQFRDVSDHNIHIVWETTILEWFRKWPWLEELAPPSFREKTERSLKAYLATKPWAERTHITQSTTTTTTESS